MSSTPPTPTPSHLEVSEEEIPLCTSCLAPNDARSNFCSKCGAPLTSYAAIGPFEHLFAQGFAYRQAAERPRHPIVLLGIWLIFGPTALIGAFLLLYPPWSQWSHWGQSILGGFSALLSLAILTKTTWSYFRFRAQAHSRPTP
jgi:hypothetical protein